MCSWILLVTGVDVVVRVVVAAVVMICRIISGSAHASTCLTPFPLPPHPLIHTVSTHPAYQKLALGGWQIARSFGTP